LGYPDFIRGFTRIKWEGEFIHTRSYNIVYTKIKYTRFTP